MPHTELKQQAHTMIDVMSSEKIAALVPLLDVMLDPVERSLANAPWDDEPVSEEEKREIAASHTSVENSRFVSNAEVLADYGLTEADFERMGRTPFEASEAEKV